MACLACARHCRAKKENENQRESTDFRNRPQQPTGCRVFFLLLAVFRFISFSFGQVKTAEIVCFYKRSCVADLFTRHLTHTAINQKPLQPTKANDAKFIIIVSVRKIMCSTLKYTYFAKWIKINSNAPRTV